MQGAEPDLPLLTRFDRDANRRLDRAERSAARAWLQEHPEARPPMRGRQLPPTGRAGERLVPADVAPVPATIGLYDSSVVRTLFQCIPAPRANFVRVVVNEELWGVYVNQQPFSKALLREQLRTDAGTRWKSPNNSPGGGFGYLGDSIALYRRWYEQKGKDDPAAWRALRQVTHVLDTTPPDRLEAALASRMDVDEVLRFLALDMALVNGDGYWNDGSDFNVLLGADGRFRALPHDVNEAFRGRGDASTPDPLIALDDERKALRRRLLAVPALRTRYLRYVGEIAETWLDWQQLGPLVDHYVALIEDHVARDTRKHFPTAEFRASIYGTPDASLDARTVRGFAHLRRAALLAHPAVRDAMGR